MKWIAIALNFLLIILPAQGQQAVRQTGTVTPGHPSVWITNGVIGDRGATASLLGFTPPYVINIVDYGAKCDGVTDDAAAINRATAIIRAIPQVVTVAPWSLVSPTGPNMCLIKSSINLTGIAFHGGNVQLNLLCQTSGTPCVDALGSRFINWENLVVTGSATNSPSIGLQIGRISAAAADDMALTHVVFDGFYTFTAFYNFASEDAYYANLYAYNRTAGGSGVYSVVLDGYNHFNIQSAFVTQTNPPDTAVSFNSSNFWGGDILNNSSGSAMWVGGTSYLTMRNTYIASFGTTAVTLYCETQCINRSVFETHIEKNVTSAFFITGTDTTPTLDGFLYHDVEAQETGSVFSVDTGAGLMSVNLLNADISVTSFYPSNTGPTIFDDPMNFGMVGGTFSVPIFGNWNPPNLWGGVFCFGGECTYESYPGRSLVTGNGLSSTSNSGVISWRNGGAIISFPAIFTVHIGNLDAASPSAQTLGAQGVAAGNGNTAAPNFTINGALSNGSGCGNLVFGTTLGTASSGVQNSPATALTLVGCTQAIQFNSSTYANCTALTTTSNVLGCTASALEFKNRGEPITEAAAWRKLDGLRVESWKYKDPNRFDALEHVSLYADDVEKLDPRCVTRENGKVHDYWDRCVVAYLVADRNMLKKRIIALEKKSVRQR